jgi:hypothetical protein
MSKQFGLSGRRLLTRFNAQARLAKKGSEGEADEADDAVMGATLFALIGRQRGATGF